MTWKRSTRRSFCLLVTVLLVSCATPATRSDLTPTFSGLTSPQITIGVVDSRSYVISGDKEPWFEGIVRGGFGIPYTFNRPDRPPNETFADRIAEMLERTFTDAGSQVTVVRLARGSTQSAARGKLKPHTMDAALLIRIHDSRFDAGGFSFDYPYHFQLSVLDREGNTLAQASVQGRDANTPSGKYNVWDMYGVVYRDKLEQLLVKPEIQLAIASPARTVPVEKNTVSVEQAETETVGKNTESVSEATAITSGLLAQSEQETQRREQYAKADGKAVAETLAALKVLHGQGVLSDEEYMQKQREVINEHTRKTQESLAGYVSPDSGAAASLSGVATAQSNSSASTQPLTVVILPPGRSVTSAYRASPTCCSEEEILAHLRAIINRKAGLLLIDSPYSNDSPAKYWAGIASKSPILRASYSAAQESNADLAFLFDRQRQLSSVDITAYILDVRSKEVFSKHGRLQSLENVDSIFQSLLRTVLWGGGTSVNIVEENRRKLEAQCAAQPERC